MSYEARPFFDERGGFFAPEQTQKRFEVQFLLRKVLKNCTYWSK